MKFFTLENAITVVALLFFTLSFSQEKIVIQLLVDVKNFDPSDIPSSCSLRAIYSNSGEKVESGRDLENFTVTANLDDTIVWEGVALNSDTAFIDIKKIKRENESQIFRNRRNYGEKRPELAQPKEIVETKIIYTTKDKPDYKYTLYFKINGEGRTYKIDPKIKVGSLVSRDAGN